MSSVVPAAPEVQEFGVESMADFCSPCGTLFAGEVAMLVFSVVPHLRDDECPDAELVGGRFGKICDDLGYMDSEERLMIQDIMETICSEAGISSSRSLPAYSESGRAASLNERIISLNINSEQGATFRPIFGASGVSPYGENQGGVDEQEMEDQSYVNMGLPTPDREDLSHESAAGNLGQHVADMERLGIKTPSMQSKLYFMQTPEYEANKVKKQVQAGDGQEIPEEIVQSAEENTTGMLESWSSQVLPPYLSLPI